MKNSTFKISLAVLCLSLALGLGACAKSQKPGVTYNNSHEIADPIEPVNRFIFGFNDILDRILLEPIAKGYKAVLPSFARDAVQSFMHNLQSPLIIANNLLQGSVGDAGVAGARFFINTTVGIGGLVDVAKAQGLSYENEDFGQTLAVWGLGDGFYLVLPVLGPSSLRDAAGLMADSYADPVRIVSDNTDNKWIYYTRGIVDGIDTRARLIKAIDDLRRNSLDYYAAARSAYSQKRSSLIRDDKSGTAPQTLNYDDPQ
ncbi:MAG: VacJ family lipoprotein [Alphaproteobacteria bacterium]|nr:VacJ family lipoprotein [Alphaproteobacteria bacterium]